MFLKTRNGFCASFGRAKLHLLSLQRVILSRTSPDQNDMLHLDSVLPSANIPQHQACADLLHKQIRSGVQAASHRIIQGVFESLLFAHNAIKKIRAVYVRGLRV